MRPRNLALLAAAVVALGSFLWFFERGLPGSDERAERSKLLLPELAGDGKDAVTAVVVEQGGERVRLLRQEATGEEAADDEETADEDAVAAGLLADDEPAADWRFAAPAAYAGRRADAAAVDGLLSALAGVARERDVDDVDPQAAGLDAPRARVVLERGAGEALDLAVGGEVPASTWMLVAVAGRDGAVAVDRGLYDDLTRRRPGDWRARDLFAAGRDEIERLEIEGDAGRVVLERRDGDFRLAGEGADGGDLADDEAVDELLSALTGLTAVRFVDDPAAETADPGLAPPRGAVTAGLAGGGSLRVEVGAETDAGTVHLRVGDQVVTARTQLVTAIERPAAAWPSRRLTALRPFEIERLTIAGDDGGMALERDGTDWRRDGVRIPYTPVSDLLYAITDARAEEVLPRANLRLRGPALSVELGGEATAGGDDGEPEDEAPPRGAFRLHAAADAIEPDGRVAATVDGRDRVLQLASSVAMNLYDKVAAVRAAEPLPEPEEEPLPDGVEVEVEEGDDEAP